MQTDGLAADRRLKPPAMIRPSSLVAAVTLVVVTATAAATVVVMLLAWRRVGKTHGAEAPGVSAMGTALGPTSMAPRTLRIAIHGARRSRVQASGLRMPYAFSVRLLGGFVPRATYSVDLHHDWLSTAVGDGPPSHVVLRRSVWSVSRLLSTLNDDLTVGQTGLRWQHDPTRQLLLAAAVTPASVLVYHRTPGVAASRSVAPFLGVVGPDDWRVPGCTGSLEWHPLPGCLDLRRPALVHVRCDFGGTSGDMCTLGTVVVPPAGEGAEGGLVTISCEDTPRLFPPRKLLNPAFSLERDDGDMDGSSRPYDTRGRAWALALEVRYLSPSDGHVPIADDDGDMGTARSYHE